MSQRYHRYHCFQRQNGDIRLTGIIFNTDRHDGQDILQDTIFYPVNLAYPC